MRRTWALIKDETMTKSEQRQAHVLATRDLANLEFPELHKPLEVSHEDLAKGGKSRVKGRR